MRDWKTFIPLGVALGVVALAAALAPTLAREISYSITLGRSRAARSELAEMNSRYGHLSQMFRLAAKAVGPAVVEVHVYGPNPLSGVFTPDFGQGNPVQYGLGSGVVIDAEAGHVLTNHHVIAEAEKVEIVLRDGRRFPAEWVRSDKDTDLAVVKVAPEQLIAAPLGDSDRMQVGDLVLAIGAPDGLSQSVTSGIISAKGRTSVGGGEIYRDFMQTDAAINKGNSGGPLINLRGEVIGINTAIHSRSGGYEGIGFAIPANMARPIIRQLIESGTIVRGFLGVRMQPVTPGLVESFSLPHARGVLIAQVAPAGPAGQAGLQEGDFLTEIDGRDVRNTDDVRTIIASKSPGQQAELTIIRQGQRQSLPVVIGRQPEDMARAMVPRDEAQTTGPGLSALAMTPERARIWGFDPELRGAVLVDVVRDSPAWRAGLRPGQLVTHVDARPIRTEEELFEAIDNARPGRGVRLRVRDQSGYQRFVQLQP